MSREAKLKYLADKKAQKTSVTVKKTTQNRTKFVEKFGEQINRLETLFDKGINVDYDALLDQLKNITGLETAIKTLEDTIKGLNTPSTVTIKGLNDLVDVVKSLKIPDANIKIDFIEKELANNILEALGSINKGITERKVPQTVGDFVPVRRVFKVGDRLVFDDTHHGGSSGGGGVVSFVNSVGDATTVKLNADGEVPVIADEKPPTDVSLNNASLVLGYAAPGLITITKTIGGIQYQKTLSYTGSDLTGISSWVQL
jgi:hypothetical protein